MRPSCAFIFRPIKEGAGNAGCPLHPQPPVQCRKHRGRSHRYTGNHPAFPHAMVLTAYVGLSPVTGLFCHRHFADIVLSLPGWADRTPQNLTPASGRQDHMILLSAASISRQHTVDRSRIHRIRPAIPSRAKRCRVHRIPRRVRDDRDTPLVSAKSGRMCQRAVDPQPPVA